MHEDGTSGIETILDEAHTGRKMLQQIFVIDIVDLDDLVRVGFEELLV